MSGARYIVGDVFDVLASLEPGSVDLVMSSPPFLALRSYLPADHPDKGKEIGSEATPGEFIDTMLDVVEACGRVLAPHGSLVFELGDTYSGAGGYGSPDSPNPAYGAERFAERWEGRTRRRFKKKDDGWPPAKSKALIPQLFAVALAYGFNPLTGRETEPWRVRNVVAWARPNPPVGRDGDKFRPATSYLTVATKARDRYWDGDAVRVPYSQNSHARVANGVESQPRSGKSAGRAEGAAGARGASWDTLPERNNDGAGAPLLDYWVLPTESYSGSHYATFPRKLVVPVVASMCPQRVCRVCGEPSRRIVAKSEDYERFRQSQRDYRASGGRGAASDEGKFVEGRGGYTPLNNARPESSAAEYETLGWSDCGCYTIPDLIDHWRPGCVLDPFAGSGTTLAVATGHGFDAIGVDLDSRNADLAAERIGPMFLTVETLDAKPAA